VGADIRVRRAGAHAALAGFARRAGVVVVARGAVGLEAVRGTGVRRAVAALGDVALVHRRAADRGALRVRRAVVVDAVAALGEVAGACRRPADRRTLSVRRTVVADAVTALRHVAHTGRRAADGGALRVRGAVARARRGPEGDRRRLEAVRRAVVVGAVAVLRDVAWSCRGPAFRGALAVGRTGRARARAVLGRIADAGRGPTLDRARQERVG